MKKILNYVLIASLAFGCTDYKDDIKIVNQDYNTLTPENIVTDLKVANLIFDQAEFDDMYENFTEDIEIDGFLNLYKNGETLIENEAIEVQLKGSYSSTLGLKSLGVKFDDTYHNDDRKLIDPVALPFHNFDRIRAFRFRNSGNDFKATMLKDESYTRLAVYAGLDLDLMYAEPSVVFVNGAFLGVMNIRTEGNTNGMAGLYDADKDDVTLAKINEGGILEEKDGDFDRIDNFLLAIENGDYDYVSKEIDIDNFIDYMAFESFIGNIDWPKNNVRFFAIKDGPFRFVMFDLDLASTRDLDRSPLSYIFNPPQPNMVTDLFNVMYANEGFKQKYDARFKNLMDSGLLSATNFNTVVTGYKNVIEHMMPTQISKYNSPESFTQWYNEIEYLKDNYKAREEHVK